MSEKSGQAGKGAPGGSANEREATGEERGEEQSQRDKLEQMLIAPNEAVAPDATKGPAVVRRIVQATESDSSEKTASDSTQKKAAASADPAAGTGQTPDQAESAEKLVADDNLAHVDYDAIRQGCIAARKQRRKIIAVVGLATTGKSFFIRRLGDDPEVLRRRYTYVAHRGIPPSGEVDIPRTRDVLRYNFNIVGAFDSPRNFDIFDVPGDQFRKLAERGWVADKDDREALKLFYIVFAHADAFIFIVPALQVLMGDEYIEYGDDLALEKHERILRARELDTFIQSLHQMTKVILLLKELVPVRGIDNAVEDVLKLDFQGLQEAMPRATRLAMPALLLLSRADELERRVNPGIASRFDSDPATDLVRRAATHFEHLAQRFDIFAADFLTAESGHKKGVTTFNPRNPHFGAQDTIDRWLLPAIALCRRRGWRRFFQRSMIAIRLRRLLDPEFAAIWKRRQ